MNVIKKKWLVVSVINVGMWSAVAPGQAQQKPAVLKDIVHERALKPSQSLEMGTITFLCSDVPQVSTLVHKDGSQEVRFFVTPLIVDADLDKRITQFNDQKIDDYIARIEKKKNGLQVRLAFDTQKVSVRQQVDHTIKNEVRVSFNLYNKLLLEKIRQKEKRFLRVASL